MSAIDEILGDSAPAWGQARCGQRLRQHLLASLVSLGRHTVTGLLTTCGRAFEDWTADYRLYSHERVDPAPLFSAVRRGVEQALPDGEPLVVGMDDSIVRKWGTQIPGVAWRRDPLGPPFATSFVRGQRFVQVSGALPLTPDGAARMLPIQFRHAPTVRRPRRHAPAEEWDTYRSEQKHRSITQVGSHCLADLRAETTRPIWAAVDGRFTNGTILKGRPANLTVIGRIRGDAKLYGLPSPPGPAAAGRRRRYGERIPTPEAVRTDDTIPWQEVVAYAAGERRTFRLKTLAPVRWRTAGGTTDLRLIVVAPLGYRLRTGGRLLYRRPAYLICTDPDIPLDKALQAYLWRWDVEVNFRDEKTVLGIGEAQVRHPASVDTLPAFRVAAYAVLLLAAARAYGPAGRPETLPPPAWRKKDTPPRATTMNLIQQLRYELWAQAIQSTNFSGFTSRGPADQKPEKFLRPLEMAAFYAQTG